MPADPLKSNGWTADGNSTDISDQQISQYYNAAASQYNQHYNLYSSPYYRFPYLPTANASAIYGHGYSAGFDYNGYPAYGVQYYNKSMGTNNSSPISTFQQYTNNLVTGNFNTVAVAAINQSSNGSQSTSNYYSNNTQKASETKPRKTKRKKQTASSGKQEVIYKRVYVWELDDMFGDEFTHQLLYNQDLKKLIEQLLSQSFQLNSVDDFDHTNIEDANVDESLNDPNSMYNNHLNDPSSFNQMNIKAEAAVNDKQQVNDVQPGLSDSLTVNLTALDNIKRMAACQQRIRSIYSRYQQDFMGLIKSCGLEAEIPSLCRMLDPFRRLDANRPLAQCIKLINERSAQALTAGGPQQAVVVVAREPLSFALAKMLIHGSASLVSVENVYSASRNDISQALDRVVVRFKREKLVMITSKPESIQLSRSLNIPVWPLAQPKDLDNFYVALDRILC